MKVRNPLGHDRVVRFEIYRDFAGRYRWRLRGRDLEVIADSARSFSTSDSASRAARRVKDAAGRAGFRESRSAD